MSERAASLSGGPLCFLTMGLSWDGRGACDTAAGAAVLQSYDNSCAIDFPANCGATMPGGIVVVGSEGQLGSELCRQLGPRAVGLDLPQLDITSRSNVMAAIETLAPAVVINAAAYTRVDQAEEEPEVCYRVNAAGVEHLAEACKRCGAVFVQLSTDYVFGGDAHRRVPYREDDPPAPQGVYARSKLAGEHAARRWPRHFIVRTCGLYGPGGARRSGNFVDAMLRLAERGGKLQVVSDQQCTPTYTRHLARAIVFLITTEAFGTYHVVNGGRTTWYEFAEEIFRIAGMEVDIQPVSSARYGSKAPRPGYSVLDTTRYHALPGAPPMPHWREAVAEYLSRRLGGRP